MANVANSSADPNQALYDLFVDRGVIRPGEENHIKKGKGAEGAQGKLEEAAESLKGLVSQTKAAFSMLASDKNFLSTPLGKELKNDPTFNKLTDSEHNESHGAKGSSSDDDDAKNIFLLILKFMKGQNELNNSAEASAALNSIVQGKMLDKLTSEASDSINTMKSQIDSAMSDLTSPNGQFLTIGLPIVLAAVSVASAGVGGVAAGAVTKGVSTAVSVGSAASVGISQAAYTAPKSAEATNAGTEGNAEMQLNSTANANVNNTLQVNTRSEQTSESNKEANNNLIEQMISNYSRLGSSNA